MHDDEHDYRIIARTRAAAIVALVAAGGALVVWLATGWMASYAEQMGTLFDRDPERARAELVRDVRIVAIVTATLLFALAAWLWRYGIRSMRCRAMPPPGSWIVAGQRTWTGEAAVRRAQLLLAASAVVLLLGLVAAAMMWRLPGVLLGGA